MFSCPFYMRNHFDGASQYVDAVESFDDEVQNNIDQIFKNHIGEYHLNRGEIVFFDLLTVMYQEHFQSLSKKERSKFLRAYDMLKNYYENRRFILVSIDFEHVIDYLKKFEKQPLILFCLLVCYSNHIENEIDYNDDLYYENDDDLLDFTSDLFEHFREYLEKNSEISQKQIQDTKHFFTPTTAVFEKIDWHDPEVIRANQKFYYLTETGIIQHLKEEYPYAFTSGNNLADLLHLITDEKQSTMQKLISYYSNTGGVQIGNSTLEKSKKRLSKIIGSQ